MSYKDNSQQHKNAVRSVALARENALDAVSIYRRSDVELPFDNLAPISGVGQLAIQCNQSAADYFLQLRPYRSAAATWDSIETQIELPKCIKGEYPGDSRGSPELRICRNPVVPIFSMSDLLEAINQTVMYSTNYEKNNLLAPGQHPALKARERPERGFSPATPALRSGLNEKYKIVFGPDILLKLIEAADEIAAEMDLLVDLEEPDHAAGGSESI